MSTSISLFLEMVWVLSNLVEGQVNCCFSNKSYGQFCISHNKLKLQKGKMEEGLVFQFSQTMWMTGEGDSPVCLLED